MNDELIKMITRCDYVPELIDIQKALVARKSHSAVVPTKRGTVSYTYRTCEDILNAVKELLSEKKCTLVCKEVPMAIGDRIYKYSIATLTNSAGKSAIGCCPVQEVAERPGMDPAQVSGAVVSYARRYALQGLFLISDDNDDDKNLDSAEFKKRESEARERSEAAAPASEEESAIAAGRYEKAKLASAKASNVKELKAAKEEYRDLIDATLNKMIWDKYNTISMI